MSATSERAHRQDARQQQVPELHSGDRLTRVEFERRYTAARHLKKAELVEGVVYVPSPVKHEGHGDPHSKVVGWLVVYEAATEGTNAGDNSTLRLDLDNEPQPDALLRIREDHGGQSRVVEGYLEGAPELIVEVAASSASYDLHDKLNAYRRNGVREYVVCRVLDEAVDWFVLREGAYEALAPGSDGIFRSEVFPGLWLDPAALLRSDTRRLLDVLHEGLAAPEHQAFVERLRGQREARG